ncbi:SDR family oxidoreductase [Sorangium sp. So ce854]|uniref:SDR family oxidoreductase n=1 Tax=Sorangium sp. So ce854 TaxID=3133322 RepID=UPI003F648884
MRILIMGGSRFNGYHLVRELVHGGHDVTVLNRGVTPVSLPAQVRRLYADRKDHLQLKEILGKEEYDCIQDVSAYTLDDVQSMVEIFEGRAGHYIFASSTAVYAASRLLPITEESPVELGPPQQDYGRNKILCERYLLSVWRQRRFPITIARFSMVLGPRNRHPDREQQMWVRLLRGREILIPGDGTTLGMVGHVEDQARAMRLMMQNPRTFGQIYNVTGKDYFTDDAYVDTLAELAGVEARKVFVPGPIMDKVAPDAVIDAGRLGLRPGGSGSPCNGRPFIQRLAPHIHGWKAPVVFSTRKLQDDLGYEQLYTFTSGMAQTYEWFEREGLADKLRYDFSAEDALLEMVKRKQAV